MAPITVHPEHVEGLRRVLDWEFRTACEKTDRGRLRDLLDLGDQIGWEAHAPVASEVRLTEVLLDRLVTLAWELGNETMSEVYSQRARGKPELEDAERDDREARSMIAFAEAHRPPVAVA